MASQPNLARTHSQNCRTCLGAAIIAKDAVVHFLPLNREKSTTRSHLPGAGQSLWLQGSRKRADIFPSKEFCLNATDEACWGFLTDSQELLPRRKAIFFGNILDLGIFFLFFLLLIFLSNQSPRSLRAHPFPWAGHTIPHSTVGTEVGLCLRDTGTFTHKEGRQQLLPSLEVDASWYPAVRTM